MAENKENPLFNAANLRETLAGAASIGTSDLPEPASDGPFYEMPRSAHGNPRFASLSDGIEAAVVGGYRHTMKHEI